jgi:hypothetical protein
MVGLRVWRDGTPGRRFGGQGRLLVVGWTQGESTVDGSKGGAMGSGIKCGHMQYGRHVQGRISEVEVQARWCTSQVESTVQYGEGVQPP